MSYPSHRSQLFATSILPVNIHNIMSSMDELLGGIIQSLEQTVASVELAESKYISESEHYLPTMIKDLLAKTKTNLEGMSLLSLKNNSLLSYINNLVLVLLCHLERINENANTEKLETLKTRAVESTVQNRVTLEKGIKPLEKKLTYQLDKMVRSYHRMEEDNARMEAKINNTEETLATQQNSASESESEDSSDDDDELSYKPDAAALAKMAKANKYSRKGKDADDKYKPPKISATAPPLALFSDRAGQKQSTRKLQSMEEYLAESSDLPQAESSIGATIVDHGRGGVKTSRDRQKEREIQRYEENNFTRLHSTVTKKTFKQKMAERANNFAGEDWSMFNNKRNITDGTSRKRKSGTAWDRVKKRHT